MGGIQSSRNSCDVCHAGRIVKFENKERKLGVNRGRKLVSGEVVCSEVKSGRN